MSIFTMFVVGLKRTLHERRLALRLWLASFLFTLLVVAPAAFVTHDQLAHSLTAGTVLAKLDIHWLTDLSSRYLDVAPAFLALVAAAAILYLLLVVFLNGGVIGGLQRPAGTTTLAVFFHDCGLYFWRFLRLFLLSLPVYLLALGISMPLLRITLGAIGRRATTEWPAMIAANLRLLILVLLLGIVSMFFDYVKIGLAARDGRKVLNEAWRTLKTVGRRFVRAWGLYLLAGLAFVLLTLLYLEVVRVLPKRTPLMVLAVLLWQQLYILGRQMSKVLFFATELEFARQEIFGKREKKREE